MFVQPEARVDAGAREVVPGSLVLQLAGMSRLDTLRGFVRLIPLPEDGGPADQLPARIQALVSLPLEDVEPSGEDELPGAARTAVGDSPVAADEDRELPLDSPLVFPLSPPRRRTNGRLILKATETATRNYDHTLQLDVRLVPVQDAKVGREAAALTEASEAQGQGSGAAGPRRALVIETAPFRGSTDATARRICQEYQIS